MYLLLLYSFFHFFTPRSLLLIRSPLDLFDSRGQEWVSWCVIICLSASVRRCIYLFFFAVPSFFLWIYFVKNWNLISNQPLVSLRCGIVLLLGAYFSFCVFLSTFGCITNNKFKGVCGRHQSSTICGTFSPALLHSKLYKSLFALLSHCCVSFHCFADLILILVISFFFLSFAYLVLKSTSVCLLVCIQLLVCTRFINGVLCY